MFRALALSTLALLALDGVSVALDAATGLSITREAAAADFTGKIKRLQIRKRRTGSGFKVVAVTAGDSADSVASADITLADAATGELLQALTLDDGLRGRVVFTGQLDDLAEGSGAGGFTITFKAANLIDSGGDPFGEQQEFEVSVDGLEARTATDTTTDGWKIRTHVNAAGELTVVLSHEDKSWGGAGTVEAAVSVDAGPAVALGVDEVRQRFQADLAADFIFEDHVIFMAELKDAEGNVLDTLEQLVSPPSEAIEPSLTSATLKETGKGAAKLVSWSESDGQAASLEVELVDNATGESVIMTTDDTPVQTVRFYEHDLVEFEPGEDAGGYVYICLIDLINQDGDPFGEQMEVELTVPTYDLETDTAGTDWQVLSDSTGLALGVVGFYATAEGRSAVLAFSGDGAADVAGANLIFEEPYEGPAPLEPEYNLELSGQVDKWIQKGDGAVPDNYTLITTLVTPEGEVLDSTTASGGGTGTVYKTSGNGKGTKKSTQTFNNIIELL
jgi:hypothetical protein